MAIELSRNITFGQYLDLKSPVHRLDPRTKIVACAALMIATFMVRSFLGLGILLVAAAIIQVAARIPFGYTLRGMRLLIGTVLFLMVFQVLFYPNPDPATTYWSWWILSISADGIHQAALLFVRIILLYYWTSTLMFTTAMMDLADGIEVGLNPLKRIGIPVNELVLAFVIALKFVPLLVAELERMIKAQSARGARFDQGNLVARVTQLGSLLIPLFVNAFGRAEVLTTAMNARCYRGGRGRTKRRLLTFHRTDALALLVAIGFAAAAIATRWQN